jgi:V/A-type H+/Na+-transporting ATPase subunit I
MTVAKMKRFQIVGHKNDIDLVSYQIIKNGSIQLVNYNEFLITDIPRENIKPLQCTKDYTNLLNSLNTLLDLLNIEKDVEFKYDYEDFIDIKDMEEELRNIHNKVNKLIKLKENIKKEEKRLEDLKKHIWFLRNLDIDLEELKELSYISLTFGRVERDNFERLIKNITDWPIIIFDIYRKKENVWFFAFTKKEYEERTLNFLNSVYFERIKLPSRVKGYPREILQRSEHRLKRIKIGYDEIELELKKYIHLYGDKLKKFYSQLIILDRIKDINNKFFGELDHHFLINGWIPEYKEKDFVENFEEKFQDTIYTSQEVEFDCKNKPPTVLKNKFWVKPFESLISLYGTPNYGEVDPSAFVAISYLLMFGMMFGDVGQGAVFALVGYLIFRFKNQNRNSGLLLMELGISSIIFGFLYGSIFGLEHYLPTLWLKPMENIMFWLGISVALGIFLMLISMVLNLINSYRRRDLEVGVFSRNGLSGIFFYILSLFTVLYLIMKGRLLFQTWLNVILLITPLVLIFMHKPIINIIKRKGRYFPENIGEYFLESGFELFDTIINFLSNTISFVRIGAFTLNHAGLFMAVFIMADMVKGVFASTLVIILGNVMIMILEGLVVGIQVLRLEYFELFGKFFKGDGEKFSPIKLN